MKKLIIFISLFFFSLTSYSCLNEYRENMQGEFSDWRTHIGHFYQTFHIEYCEAFVDRFDFENKEQYEFKEMSDASVHLAHLGRYEESLDVLRWLIHDHPEDYIVVSNLGTLYELNGMNDSAHFYISKAIELNPESHNGSEWFHLKILDAKMELEKNQNWHLENQVMGLNLDYAVEMHSRFWDKIEDTIFDINHQLRERIPFTPAPDLIMANVMTEFGDMLGPNFSIEEAYYAYEIANHYDPENLFDQKDKSEEMKFLLKDVETTNTIGQIFRPEGEYQEEGEMEELVGSESSENQDKPKKKAPEQEWGIEVGPGFYVVLFIVLTFAGAFPVIRSYFKKDSDENQN